MTERELAHMLAALRFCQRETKDGLDLSFEEPMYAEGFVALGDEEVDALCEKLNFAATDTKVLVPNGNCPRCNFEIGEMWTITLEEWFKMPSMAPEIQER